MSYNIASLTPSRPAPPVPGGGSRSAAPPHPSGSQGSSQANPNFSSSSYASSFPILNPASALNPGAHSHEGRKTVIRTGHASVKEEGLRSFLWSKRWLVLGGTDLQIFKNEVGSSTNAIEVALTFSFSLTLPLSVTRIPPNSNHPPPPSSATWEMWSMFNESTSSHSVWSWKRRRN